MIPFWKKLETRSAPTPASIPIRSSRNNKITPVPMSMPFKSANMTQGGSLARARKVYRSDSGGGRNWYGASDATALRRITAIGLNAKTVMPWTSQTGIPQPPALSTAKGDPNVARSHLRRCRSGGSRAPLKKGAIGNKFRGGGCC